MIKIFEGIYLDADTNCIMVVYTRINDAGDEKEVRRKYYNTLDAALCGVMRQLERKNVSEARTLRCLLDMNHETYHKIAETAEAVSPQICL